MKKYIYILLTFCLLISCMEDPTAGVVVPKYTPSTAVSYTHLRAHET